MRTVEVPVLAVGGGGCGLSASVFLADHGVDHLLIERHSDTSRLPKAHYLNQRTMEIFRQHGVDGPVIAQGAPLAKFGKVRWQTSLAGDDELDARVIHEMDAFGGGALRETYAAAGPVMPKKLPQFLLEPILRRYAEERNPGRILFGHELTGCTDEGDRVVAEVREHRTGQSIRVVAQYVVAADGGRTIGPALGVEMQGPPPLINITTAYFAADLSAWWREGTLLTHFLNPHDPGLSSNLIEMGPTWGRNCEEWGLHFASVDKSRFDERTIVPRIRQVLGVPELELTVHGVTHWNVEAVLAERYRSGRVLLAGDAAHRQPPAVGLGLNTGIQDAHNLAWKLAVVLTGRADDGLLDTYEVERRPVGRENIDWALSAAAHHRAILDAIGIGEQVPPERRLPKIRTYFDPSPLGETARARAAGMFETHRGGCQALDMEIGFGYESDAIISDGSRPPHRAPMRDEHHPTTRPGHRLPHAWLERDGARLSTHDLTGTTGFALITGTAGTPWCAAAAQLAEKFSIPVTAARIGDGAEYADVDGRWAAVREVTGEGAVLVRPDNHVAWRSIGVAENPADALGDAIARVLVES